MACNKKLQADGATTWPRTCSQCKLGPCTHPDYAPGKSGHADALKQIAGLIQKLSYRDMLALGKELSARLNKLDDCDPQTCAEVLVEVADEILTKEPK